jgi:AraC family transcriptional activator of tynA and feaB
MEVSGIDGKPKFGAASALPPCTARRTGDYRASVHAARVHDSVIADVDAESIVSIIEGGPDDQVLMHVVQPGSWTFAVPRDRSEIALPAGRFILWHAGHASFEVAVRSSAKLLSLLAALLRPLIGDRRIVGPADSSGMRVLLAHANMVDTMLNDLDPAGSHAAHQALIELVKV